MHAIIARNIRFAMHNNTFRFALDGGDDGLVCETLAM